MTRPLRIEFPGALYYVTCEAEFGEDLFPNESDRTMFLQIYGDVCDRMKWKNFAWCLLDRTCHFVIETPEPNLSEGMKLLRGVYTQKFNRSYNRVGHIFQGRYGAIHVDRDSFLLPLIRYVELKPVKAGKVENPLDWHWSSCKGNSGLAPPQVWQNKEGVLSFFRSEENGNLSPEHLYIAYVYAGITEDVDLLDSVKQQIYLGDEDFIVSMQNKVLPHGKMDGISREQIRKPLGELAKYEEKYPILKEAMARAYLSGNYTQGEVARYFRVHRSTVARAVREFRGEEKP
jgi:REP element-mobilizing transposase RayT